MAMCSSAAYAADSPNLFESLGKLLKPKAEASAATENKNETRVAPLGAGSSSDSRNLNIGRSEKRIALVIGNSDYKDSPLKNPVNDAKDMAGALRKLGFDVIEKTDATQREMNRAIAQFGERLRSDTVALFFYAGHGMQVKGKNYIIPIDAHITGEASVRAETVDVDSVMDQLAVSPMNIVILDACRNNPFERRFRSTSGGLAQMDAPKGSLIAYATAPGKTAADGEGRNGLYTQELLKNIQTPGLPLEAVFKRVRNGVMVASGEAQTPWESSSLTGDFYFFGPTALQGQQSTVDPEAETWAAAERAKTMSGYQEYLKAYPNGRFASAARINLDALPTQVAKPNSPSVSTLVPAVATSAKIDDQEVQYWNEVKTSNSREYFNAYLTQYPKGKYVSLAKVELKKQDERDKADRAKAEADKKRVAEQEKQEALRAEQAAWEDAKLGSSVASYAIYLDRFPKGRFASLAQAAKQKAQREEAEREQVVAERIKREQAEAAQREEAELWRKAETAQDSIIVQRYIDRYPAGSHVAQAQIKLAAVKKAESEARPLSTTGTVSLVSGNDYAPYADSRLIEGGMTTDVIKKAFGQMNISVKVDWLPWARGYEETKSGSFAATFPYLKTPERERGFLYSDVVVKLQDHPFIKAGNYKLNFSNVSSLEGTTICLPLGWAPTPKLANMIKNGQIKKSSPRDISTCVKMVATDQADYFVSDEGQGQAALRTGGVPVGLVVMSDVVLADNSLYLIFGRDTPGNLDLLGLFNKGLASLRNSGAYAQIVRAHSR